MKLIHLSDLHLGKRVYEYSMIEDQAVILDQILTLIEQEAPKAVVIAGDVYDKSVPSAEAVRLFDRFLVSLARQGRQVFIISGNHDSPERLAFGGRLMDARGIHLSPVYEGTVKPITLTDAWGDVDFYLLPFVKPNQIRQFFGEDAASTYQEAMQTAVGAMELDKTRRNVLVTHQFVTGARTSDSEERSVGGSQNVDAAVFGDFDYVALGHIHRPQNCGSPAVRYCGTPLKYSFSEAGDQKSLTVVTLEEKGSLDVRTIPLHPRRDLVELRGTYEELMTRSFYRDTTWQEDYVHLTLTDEEEVPDALRKLQSVYHNVMTLDYDNTRTRQNQVILAAEEEADRSPMEHIAALYELQNNKPLSPEQEAYLKTVLEKIWEGQA